MKIGVDGEGALLIIYAENESNCACQIDEEMLDEKYEIDDMSYIGVWSQVCREVFGSRLFNRKDFTISNYTIFYYRSRFKLIADMQKSHMQFVAHMANLEYERIDSLLSRKHGTQLKLVGVE